MTHNRDIIMTDEEVAKFWGISVDQLQRKMREGFGPHETNLAKAHHEVIGRRRWWYRPDMEALAAGKEPSAVRAMDQRASRG